MILFPCQRYHWRADLWKVQQDSGVRSGSFTCILQRSLSRLSNMSLENTVYAGPGRFSNPRSPQSQRAHLWRRAQISPHHIRHGRQPLPPTGQVRRANPSRITVLPTSMKLPSPPSNLYSTTCLKPIKGRRPMGRHCRRGSVQYPRWHRYHG